MTNKEIDILSKRLNCKETVNCLNYANIQLPKYGLHIKEFYKSILEAILVDKTEMNMYLGGNDSESAYNEIDQFFTNYGFVVSKQINKDSFDQVFIRW